MNYIQEINAFYDWLEGNPPLTKNGIALWHALMHINNKTKWARTFHAAISTLETKSGISRSELFKARKELEAAGFIDWKQRQNKQCASYTMIPLWGRSNVDLPNELDDQIGDDYYDKTGLRHSDEDNDDEGGLPEETQGSSDENHGFFDENQGDTDDDHDDAGDDSEKTKNPPIQDYVGDNSGDNSGNNSGNKKGTNPATISKGNKKKQNKTKNQFDGGKPPLSSTDDEMERKKINKKVFKIFNEYNRLCLNLPRMTTKTEKRKAHVKARLKEHGLAKVQKMLTMAAASDFLGGYNNNAWKANFDWLFLPTNFVKVLEGNYTNKPVNAEDYIGKPSHLQIIEQTYNNLMNDGFFE